MTTESDPAEAIRSLGFRAALDAEEASMGPAKMIAGKGLTGSRRPRVSGETHHELAAPRCRWVAFAVNATTENERAQVTA